MTMLCHHFVVTFLSPSSSHLPKTRSVIRPKYYIKTGHYSGNMVKVTIDGQEEGLLIVGGQKPRSGVSEYHGKSGRWVQVAALPINVSSAQMAWNSDTKMMYHFGGFSGGQNSLKDGMFSMRYLNIFYLRIISVYTLQYLGNDKWENAWKRAGQLQLARDSGRVSNSYV